MEESERIKQAVTGTASAIQKGIAGTGGKQPTEGRADRAFVERIIEHWAAVPQKVARRMIEKYGPPNEAIPSRLIWYQNGPWKRTILYRDEVPHNFPKPHTDVLEQYINYRVPPEKFDELAAFDGSVVADRTKGEVMARCDMEEMNFLSLNLVHDIVTGKRTVEEARKFYAETAVAFMMNRPAPYTERLQFEVPTGDTADLDEVMITEAMMHQIVGKGQRGRGLGGGRKLSRT
jgi:hypothetical protein